MNPLEALDTVPSKGRRIPQVLKMSDESVQVWDPPSRPCPGCGDVTSEGDEITKMHRAWWHVSCARSWLADVAEPEAWKVIARQMAAHPSRYKTSEIRTVIERLLGMLG